MTMRLLRATDAGQDRQLDRGDLRIEAIVAAGELLDVSYQLLAEVFAADVLPSLAFFLSSLSDASQRDPDSRLVFLAATIRLGDERIVVACSSSHLLRLDAHRELAMLAVGNIATSPHLQTLGVRGAGSRLLVASGEAAAVAARELGATLAYAVAEAETRSLGFWQKQGFRWPEGLRYWQPPLEFAATGAPVHPEVAETLVVRPYPPAPADAIDGAIVADVVRTIYEQWSLRRQRAILAPAALARAEAYVMETVFAKTAASLPRAGGMRLVEPLSSGAN